MRAGRTQGRARRLSTDGRAVIASGLRRLAGTVFDDDTRLAPEPLIAAAAKATRLDVKPLADPRLVEALAALYLAPPGRGVAIAIRTPRGALGPEADALDASDPRGR